MPETDLLFDRLEFICAELSAIRAEIRRLCDRILPTASADHPPEIAQICESYLAHNSVENQRLPFTDWCAEQIDPIDYGAIRELAERYFAEFADKFPSKFGVYYVRKKEKRGENVLNTGALLAEFEKSRQVQRPGRPAKGRSKDAEIAE